MLFLNPRKVIFGHLQEKVPFRCFIEIKLDLKYVQSIQQILHGLPISSKSYIYIHKDTIKHECVISRNISHIYLRHKK